MPDDWPGCVMLAVSAASTATALFCLGYGVITFYCSDLEQDPREQGETGDHHHDPARGHGEPVVSNPPGVEPNAAHDQNELEREHRLAEQRHWKRQTRIAVWLNWLTALAAVAALGGLWVLKGTLNTTSAQVDVMRRSERPWALIDSIVFEQPLTSNEPLRLRVLFNNSGHSPAFVDMIDLNAHVDPGTDCGQPRYGVPAIYAQMILGAGQTKPLRITVVIQSTSRCAPGLVCRP